jgi:hypothetical protein
MMCSAPPALSNSFYPCCPEEESGNTSTKLDGYRVQAIKNNRNLCLLG